MDHNEPYEVTPREENDEVVYVTLRKKHVINPLIIIQLENERERQNEKYGANRNLSIGDFIVIMRKELEEAEEGFVKCKNDEHSAINEIKQLAAVCVACLEKHGEFA